MTHRACGTLKYVSMPTQLHQRQARACNDTFRENKCAKHFGTEIKKIWPHIYSSIGLYQPVRYFHRFILIMMVHTRTHNIKKFPLFLSQLILVDRVDSCIAAQLEHAHVIFTATVRPRRVFSKISKLQHAQSNFT